jgi:hypothetical protein
MLNEQSKRRPAPTHVARTLGARRLEQSVVLDRAGIIDVLQGQHGLAQHGKGRVGVVLIQRRVQALHWQREIVDR